MIGMEPGCEGGSGRSEQTKKKMATHWAVWEPGEVGTGWDAAKKQPGKEKQAVSKESEGGGLTPGEDREWGEGGVTTQTENEQFFEKSILEGGERP